MIDLLGIGNAIIDVVSMVDDEQFAELELVRGSMTLIDGEQAATLRSTIVPELYASGGSVANSIFCCANLGGRCKFIGKVADDELGDEFAHDLADASVDYDTVRLTTGMPTAQSYVFVTPDAQRTFCTYLGATTQLAQSDYGSQSASEAKAILIEGYLWDSPLSLDLIEQSAKDGRSANAIVALSLSDPFLVDRHRALLQNFVASHANAVIANEMEAERLHETTGLDETLEAIASDVDLCVVTRGSLGSVAVANGERLECEAVPADKVVDTTGAGDAYAGGFFCGVTRGDSIADSMALASKVASKTVSFVGARPRRGCRFPTKGEQ